MNSLYRFIVKPLKERYDNTVKVEDKELVINSRIETFQCVSKKAVIVAIPKTYIGDISVGDRILIHHNVFRRFYDMKGNEKNSASFFKDDLFFCDIEQIYLYEKDSCWYCNLNYCFVHPVVSTNNLTIDKEESLVGIIKYGNKFLDKIGVNPGTVITFTPNSEFEFIVDGERLYCMKSNDIALVYEYKEDKVKHNPSWAYSG